MWTIEDVRRQKELPLAMSAQESEAKHESSEHGKARNHKAKAEVNGKNPSHRTRHIY
jgi:hypothetical protein